MAIYHYSTNVHSRGKGHSAVAAAAYRSAQVLFDERIGEQYDWRQYRKTHGAAIAAEIVLPKGTPDRYRDRGFLWNAVESAEQTKAGDYRKNAAVAREVEASLPHEMTDAQRLKLARGYAEYLSKRYGAAVDLAIHAPHTQGDQRNHHVHFLMSTRQLGPEGFGEKTELELRGDVKKARGYATGKEQVKEMRESWATHVNREMKRGGFAERIDHRSLKDQGVKRAPTRHMGPDATAMDRKGKDTRIGEENRKIEVWNRELAELEWQESVISAAIEAEERRIAKEASRARKQARRQYALQKTRAVRERLSEARRRISGKGSFAAELDAQRAAEAKAEAEEARKEKIFGQQRRNIEETLKHRPPANRQERERLEAYLRDEDKRRNQTRAPPPSPAPDPKPTMRQKIAGKIAERFDKAAAPPANDNAKDQGQRRQKAVEEFKDRLRKQRAAERGRDRGRDYER